MDIYGTGISSRLGRFDYQDGLEALSGNPKIDWLKRVRIGESLIGPFGWSAYTRSYDGGLLRYDNDRLNLTTFLSHPTQGGWGVYQTGDWYEQDHKAWALDGEAGYQFKKVRWQPHLRTGYFLASGDDNSSDNEHKTFYQMLPTARLYAYSPLYNLMNIEDLFTQVIAKPSKKLTLRSDLHILKLSESQDRWYVGAGPTQEEGNIFGYVGRTSNAEDDLGKLWDITLTYAINANVTISIYYGHLFGDNVIEKIYTNDSDADLAYVELMLKF